MDIGQIPAFTALREKMSFLAERQRVLAQNVANASTPGYVPSDLNVKSFDSALASELKVEGGGVALYRTSGAHLDMNIGRDLRGNFKAKKAPDSDITLDGNGVVLEDQMLKVSETRGDYETMVAIYQRAMGLMRTAIRSAGR